VGKALNVDPAKRVTEAEVQQIRDEERAVEDDGGVAAEQAELDRLQMLLQAASLKSGAADRAWDAARKLHGKDSPQAESARQRWVQESSQAQALARELQWHRMAPLRRPHAR
jgi:hypothetical protein